MGAWGRAAGPPALAATSWMVTAWGCTCGGAGTGAHPPAEVTALPPITATATAAASASAAGAGSASSGAGAAAGASSSGAATATGAAEVNAPAAPAGVPWAQKLRPLLLRDVNTLAEVLVRLYRPDGALDEESAAEVERVLWASKDEAAPRMSRRLLQLVVKVAVHFGAQEVHVISSHRGSARKGSRHRSGEALDFLFPGVPAKALAEELRTYPRVGVGLYVHPRAQYVHLDVREQSYHWIDGSPPGRSWKEHGLPDPTAAARDAAYRPEQDLPLALLPPAPPR